MGLFSQPERYGYTLLGGSTTGAGPRKQFLRLLPIVTVAALLLLITFSSLYHSQKRVIPTWPSWLDTTNPGEYLNSTNRPLPVPGADDSLLMIKTGAQVLWQRLPAQMTRLKEIYAPNQVIYSDMKETIQGYPVIDVLANVSAKISNGKQFIPYHEQQKLHEEGIPLATAGIKGGWTLDKYKWLPMFQHAYRNYPNAKWYIFYEADSFMFWNSLNRWLIENFDSEDAWYMGSRNLFGKLLFGHGGSGVVVSQGAMRKVFGGSSPVRIEDYDDDAMRICCGDALLGKVFKQRGVTMWSETLARFQGEQTWGIRYSTRLWCEPIFSLHHLLPKEVIELHEWEKTLRPNKRILYSDVYEHFVHSQIRDVISDWDNLSEDKSVNATELFRKYIDDPTIEKDGKGYPVLREACRRRCEQWGACFQWAVDKKSCRLNSRIRLGKKKRGVVSGWIGKRVDKLRTSAHCGK